MENGERMKKTETTKVNNWIGLGVLLGLVVLAGYFIYPQTAQAPTISGIRAGDIRIKGKHICLQPTDINTAPSLECEHGFESIEGERYVVDTVTLDAPMQQALYTGHYVVIEGKLTPIEILSTDHWRNYNVEGIITVEKILE